MNNTIEKFAREAIKLELSQCTEAQVLLFKRMYSPKDLDQPIDSVVNNMPSDKLDWALCQCEATLKKKQNV